MSRKLASVAALCLAQTPALSQPATTSQEIVTPAGTVVAGLPGWGKTVDGSLLRLDAPGGDLQIAIVDVGTASDAASAAATAWKRFLPDATPKLLATIGRSSKQGWDERVGLRYTASSDTPMEIYGSALRHGKAWTIILVNGTRAAVDKRDADIALVYFGLHPSDYVKESFAGRQAHPLDAERIAAMRAFVEKSIAELGIPGAAFALIDQGRTVYEGGIGVRRLGRTDPVDPQTRFLVASNTKGLTTLLLARLVDQGKLSWDEHVTTAYPGFRLADPALTRSMTFRDLVCACTGLPRQDMEWEFNTPPGTPASVTFTQLANLRPTSKMGEVFQYNNQLPSAAGYIAGHIVFPNLEVGAAYDQAMRKLILAPLKMNRTTFSFKEALSGNVAYPHSEDIDGNQRESNMLFDRVIVPFRPAGGAWSTLRDMSKYVQLELDSGRLPDGTRIVSERNLLVRRTRRIATGDNEWYGMGLWEDESTGVPVFHHGGNMPGYYSDFDVIPSARVGAVILTNSSNGNQLMRPFRRRLLELLYDGKPEALDMVAAAARDTREATRRTRASLTLPADPHVAAKLARHYVNADLGPLKIETDASGTRIITNSMPSTVATRSSADGSVSLVPIDPGADSISLTVGSEADLPTLTLRNGQHVYIFRATAH